MWSGPIWKTRKIVALVPKMSSVSCNVEGSKPNFESSQVKSITINDRNIRFTTRPIKHSTNNYINDLMATLRPSWFCYETDRRPPLFAFMRTRIKDVEDLKILCSYAMKTKLTRYLFNVG